LLLFLQDQFDIQTLVSCGEGVNFTNDDFYGIRTLIAAPDTFLQMKNLTITGGSDAIVICEILLFSPRKY